MWAVEDVANQEERSAGLAEFFADDAAESGFQGLVGAAVEDGSRLGGYDSERVPGFPVNGIGTPKARETPAQIRSSKAKLAAGSARG